jgi:N6-L-threonylcarbamoyladenine synthase
MQSWDDTKIIGATLDDAAGECFDKTARMIGLPYPGGVYSSKIAGLADQNILDFPVSMKHSPDYNFSFSGLKTAVRYYLEKQILQNGEDFILEKKLTPQEIEILTTHSLEELEIEGNELLLIVKKVCISVQSVIVEALSFKVLRASRDLEVASVGLSGGVSANPLLRLKLEQSFGEKMLLAPRPLTGDNAVMIGLAGILDWKYR